MLCSVKITNQDTGAVEVDEKGVEPGRLFHYLNKYTGFSNGTKKTFVDTVRRLGVAKVSKCYRRYTFYSIVMTKEEDDVHNHTP